MYRGGGRENGTDRRAVRSISWVRSPLPRTRCARALLVSALSPSVPRLTRSDRSSRSSSSSLRRCSAGVIAPYQGRQLMQPPATHGTPRCTAVWTSESAFPSLSVLVRTRVRVYEALRVVYTGPAASCRLGAFYLFLAIEESKLR